jgi:predicted ATPase
VRDDLPTGTVTLLFTDIEGSTRLIEELGEEEYVRVLAEHRRLLRSAFSGHGGVEVDTQGDAFLYAFADGVGALAAAGEGQDALASGPVKVRMGLHTGALHQTGEGYAGRELHRAARVAAVGHGGQVVLSAATRALVNGDLTELGEHRLKDFDELVALFQFGRERFPPLKTVSNTNLPRPASSFVGRHRERDELVSMLSNGTRLITLSGPGGSGKTRLAIETASELVPEFRAGVFWVGLSAIRDPALVTETIAQLLGAKDGLAEHIAERELLLLLDNLEQVVEAAPQLGRLLESCPNLKLLVTSRELLRITGEVEYPVPPLAEQEAVELFCVRSRLEPDKAIAELCRRLDELPLAIELAAARTSVLSPAQILERLSQRLDLLKGGRDADPRQQTLRATIEWSHDLLSGEEQRLFCRLAVFRGGCIVDAAEQVAGADLDTLQSLVDKSLVRHNGERFWMLETIREYARERLADSGDGATIRRRYIHHFLHYAEHATGLDRDSETYDQIAAELDNLRNALEVARDLGEDEILVRLTAVLGDFWSRRGFFPEARTWLQVALERSSSPPEARMQVLRYAAIFAAQLSVRGTEYERDFALADALIAEWRSIAEQTGDGDQLRLAMNAAARVAQVRGDLDTARAGFLTVQALADEYGDRSMYAATAVNLGLMALDSGDFRSSLEQSAAAAAAFRELEDEPGTAAATANVGWCALALGDYALAEKSLCEAVIIAGRLGWMPLIAGVAVAIAAVFVARSEEERAAQLLGAAATLRKELGIGLIDHTEEKTHERAVSDAKTTLGEEAFAAAWARGETMTPDEIVAFTAPS